MRIGVAQAACRLFGATGPRVLLPRPVTSRALHLPELVGAFTLHGMALALLLLLGMHRASPVDVPSGNPLSMVFLPPAPTPPAASGTHADAPDGKPDAGEAAPTAAAPAPPDDHPPQPAMVPPPREATVAPVTPLPVPAAPDRQEEPPLAPPASQPEAVPTHEPHRAPAQPDHAPSPPSLPDPPSVPVPAVEPPVSVPVPAVKPPVSVPVPAVEPPASVPVPAVEPPVPVQASPERARRPVPDRAASAPQPRPAVDHGVPVRTSSPRPTRHGPEPSAEGRPRAAAQHSSGTHGAAALPSSEPGPQTPPASAGTGPTAAAAAPTVPSAVPNAAAMAAGGAAWRAALSTWLQDHKTYPDAARRAGEQGRVVVRFTVDRTGRVEDVVLVSSSGSASLDEAAQAMLRGARLPPFPAGMTQAQVTATVPIRYALEQ